MDAFALACLVTGFVGSAEFGSAVLVHPVIRRLKTDDQLIMGKVAEGVRPVMAGMTAATAGHHHRNR